MLQHRHWLVAGPSSGLNNTTAVTMGCLMLCWHDADEAMPCLHYTVSCVAAAVVPELLSILFCEVEGNQILVLHHIPSPPRPLPTIPYPQYAQASGWRSLFSGLRPAILATAASQGIYFTVYSRLRQLAVVRETCPGGGGA